MIDLCISGTLSKDTVLFSLDEETKIIDQFSKEIHFSLEENQKYRIYFEQKSELDIPRFVEIMLKVISLPIRGIFNVITFNSEPNWEEDISAFKLAGYIDICVNEDAKVSFELKHGNFDKKSTSFIAPKISFSPTIVTEQSITKDTAEISKAHSKHLWNIASVSVLLFALLIYLLYVGFSSDNYIVGIIVSVLLAVFAGVIFFLVLQSFKKKKSLLVTLANQQEK